MTENPEKKENLNNNGNIFSIKEDYSHLTEKQVQTLSELNEILVLKEGRDGYEAWLEKQKIIKKIIQDLEDKGITSGHYILGYRMVGGTPGPEIVEFDTPNGEIAKEIRKLKK